jgi:hypothetical protein
MHAVMVYDAAREEVVLFGGLDRDRKREDDPFNPRTDTWTWNGSTWTQRFSSTVPHLDLARGAYDAANQNLVLFGFSYPTRAPETWVWNGHAWRLMQPANSPFIRTAQTMGYDCVNRRVMLYGGFNHDLSIMSETWEWDGADWTQLHPAVSPGRRMNATLGCSSTSSSVVLFGGGSVQTFSSDTWLWNGSTWTQARPLVAPPGQLSPGGAGEDPQSHRLYFFGGYPTEVWSWSGRTWTQRG